jgi:hypothetical protein
MPFLRPSLAFASLLALLLTLIPGCVSGAVMTQQIIDQSGTQGFKAPYGKVFAATVSALKSEGFPIASSDAEKGFIKTGQKVIRAVARGGNGSAVAVEITRQYIVHVTKIADGVAVAAEPRIFQGNAELSGQPIWDLDSPEGERALWARLFRDIQEAM